MATAVEPGSATRARPAESLLSRLASDPLWRAPLVVLALFATAGIILDRKLDVSFLPTVVLLILFLVGWAILSWSGKPSALCLWLAAAALGAAYHHAHQHFRAQNDIGLSAATDGEPVVVRGVIVDEPIITYQATESRLRSIRRTNPLQATLAVKTIRTGSDWDPAAGRVRLIVSPALAEDRPPELPEDLHAGDEIEVAGMLSRPRGPGNPGEFDHAAVLKDQRISAILSVRKSPDAVVRLERGWTGSLFGWLGVLHGWGQQQLTQSIGDEKEAGMATALVLGRGAEMTRSDWDKFIRTGVIHVLVISGQHVVVLAYLLWRIPPLLRFRRRYAAMLVVGVLTFYMLLVGANPPILRATVMVGIACVGYLFRRPMMPVNALAAAWLIVAAVNPTDIFTPGCQLTFLSVAVLHWGATWWFKAPAEARPGGATGPFHRLRWFFGIRYAPDPLQQLIDESRPVWQKIGLWLVRRLAGVYLVMITVWLAVAPLVAAHYHTLAPVAMLIGPPLALLSCAALVSGLLLLLMAALIPPLVPACAWVTGHCLGVSERIVDLALKLPGSHSMAPRVPEWWLWGFYASLLALLLLESLRPYWKGFLLAGMGWVCLGLVLPAMQPRPDELRCAFLAVGHGGCTIIETPDGRVLMYDVGAVVGPEVAERQVIPYLQHRGIRRIDEVFLSHADLDHFNGLLALCDHVHVGLVTRTPTFAEKDTAGVRYVIEELQARGIAVRIVHAGQTLSAGDVQIDVLHPPENVPESKQENENSRSMVLRIRHEGHSILLTGDLTGPGMPRLLALEPDFVDVLMAPHHGSTKSNTEVLGTALRPQVVISCQGPRPETAVLQKAYPDARCLDTWSHGAIEISSQRSGMVITTYRTGEQIVVRQR